MANPSGVDGVLLEWGSMLYYPRPRRGRLTPDVRIPHATPAAIRQHIRATLRRVPQVMVKITGSSTGAAALRRHLVYVTRHGQLTLTDEQQAEHRGRGEVMDVAETWRYAGSPIPEQGARKEALHISLGMPAGTDEASLMAAAQEFAAEEFGNHRHAWVFHGHQKNPHVHLVVRVGGHDWKRLNPRKADLYRWRTRFAQKLHEHGIEAQATSRAARGKVRAGEGLWQVKAQNDERLQAQRPAGPALRRQTMQAAMTAWAHIHNALQGSPDTADQELAQEIRGWLKGTELARHLAQDQQPQRQPERSRPSRSR